MESIIARLKREPVVLRVALVAILDVLVVAGVIDPPASEAVVAAVVAAANLLAALSARGKVRPVEMAQ